MKTLGRVVATGITLGIAGWAKTVNTPVSLIGAARTAGWQMANSDAYAIASYTGMNFFSGIGGVITAITLIVLLAIWWSPLKQGVSILKKEISE